VQLVTRPDRNGGVRGTGVTYVSFADAGETERAREAKHGKILGPRGIECLLYTPGRCAGRQTDRHSVKWDAARTAAHVPRRVVHGVGRTIEWQVAKERGETGGLLAWTRTRERHSSKKWRRREGQTHGADGVGGWLGVWY
jgi:hypothetical protein